MPTHSLYLTTDIPTTTPGVPNISCLGANNSLVMTFSANGDGGSPITSYQYSIDDFIADIHTISINSSPYTINNLENGRSYNIEIRAVNKNGFGTKTNSPDITLGGNKAPKPTITNIITGNGSATITFTAPSDNGGSIIDYYILTYSNDDFVTSYTIREITENPFTISSAFTNGTTYKFKLQAHNNFGDGDFSDIYTKAMPTIPSAPTINSITTPSNTTATINFTANSDGGLPITNYQYSTNAGTTFTAFNPAQTTTPLTITGLSAGQSYNIQLRAVNSINAGSATASYPITMPNKVSATGGTILTDNGYKYHIFTTTGSNTITFTQGGDIQYLIIAGGGAGGCNHGGGGGAGEVFQSSTTATVTSYNISVGTGGTITSTSGTTTSVTNGNDSSAFNITCKGGGRGGGNFTGTNNNGSGLTGGSGGGGAGVTNSPTGAISQKTNASGLGFAGGSGNPTSGGGGGGGSGSSGGSISASGSPSAGGSGGIGTNAYSQWILAIATTMNGIVNGWSSKTILGGVGYIASGGAGGSWANASVVTASAGGGGDGGTNNYSSSDVTLYPATAGIPNTGGGGGGGGSGLQLGKNGGSGLVVIRYLV